MSFADSVRADLLAVPTRKNCCRRALICGLFLGAVPDPGQRGAFVGRFCGTDLAGMAAEQLRIQFSKEPNRRRIGKCGRFYEEVSCSAPAFRKLIEDLRDPGAPLKDRLLNPDCPECRSAFVRGMFLSCGTVSDPQKTTHLEFTVPEETIPTVVGFLTSVGTLPGTVRRARGIGVYYKGSGAADDLIALMGAQRIVFELINTRIKREIRNHENRLNNCDTRNLERTVSAAARQVEAIRKLRESKRWDKLPEPLRKTALLRVENPDASLGELIRLHNPPISRSGLDHRLRRIVEEAELI